MGKDNIPFHTIIWPAMLMGYEGLRLPYDVPANEYVNMEAQKISTSRNWVINLKDAVSRYDPDPLRFALSAIMPETSDSNFTWDDFVRRNNDELVATFGNLVNRVLSMITRNFDGEIPSPVDSGKREEELFQKASETLGEVSDSLMNCRFREALGYSMALAQFTNRYLDEKAPWKMSANKRLHYHRNNSMLIFLKFIIQYIDQYKRWNALIFYLFATHFIIDFYFEQQQSCKRVH